MSNKLFGRARITVDGRLFETAKGASLDIGGVKRSPVEGSLKGGKFTEAVADSTLECDILVDAKTSLSDIGAIDDATINFTCDTGQTYIINGGYCADPPVLTEGEGKAKTKFMGPPAEEMV
ncbi:MAG: hypothetical protein JWP35_3544 [Caulobacter sp.]|nr:hypothetical protein [Caulobacter sp.]